MQPLHSAWGEQESSLKNVPSLSQGAAVVEVDFQTAQTMNNKVVRKTGKFEEVCCQTTFS